MKDKEELPWFGVAGGGWLLTTKTGSPPAQSAGSVNWWDATATENVIGACLQQIESLRGKLPMGVALSLQRAHTALKESLVNARALKPKSPNTKSNNGKTQ